MVNSPPEVWNNTAFLEPTLTIMYHEPKYVHILWARNPTDWNLSYIHREIYAQEYKVIILKYILSYINYILTN